VASITEYANPAHFSLAKAGLIVAGVGLIAFTMLAVLGAHSPRRGPSPSAALLPRPPHRSAPSVVARGPSAGTTSTTLGTLLPTPQPTPTATTPTTSATTPTTTTSPAQVASSTDAQSKQSQSPEFQPAPSSQPSPEPPPAPTTSYSLTVSPSLSIEQSLVVITLSATTYSGGSPDLAVTVNFAAPGCGSAIGISNKEGVATGTLTCPDTALPVTVSVTDSRGLSATAHVGAVS